MRFLIPSMLCLCSMAKAEAPALPGIGCVNVTFHGVASGGDVLFDIQTDDVYRAATWHPSDCTILSSYWYTTVQKFNWIFDDPIEIPKQAIIIRIGSRQVFHGPRGPYTDYKYSFWVKRDLNAAEIYRLSEAYNKKGIAFTVFHAQDGTNKIKCSALDP